MKKTRFYAFGPLNVMFLTFCGPHAAAAAQFSLAPSYATGSTPCSVAVADLNGDSKLDLVVANSGSDNVSVLIGNGDGTFQPQVSYGTGSAPSSVALGDFNGDGKLDIAVANASNNSISVLLGVGDGTFQAAKPYNAGSGPSSVPVGDFNVSLTGMGTVVKLSPTSLSFGSVQVSRTSAAKTVTLTNTGTVLLTITNIGITGTNGGDFVETNTCGLTLGAGSSCSISVMFTPRAKGSCTGSLSINDDGGGSPQTVSLSGTQLMQLVRITTPSGGHCCDAGS